MAPAVPAIDGASRLECAGCLHAPGPLERDPCPFRCTKATPRDGIDHVIRRVLDPARVRYPEGREANPFIRYRTLLHSFHLATSRGIARNEYVALASALDAAINAVDGRGFRETPFAGHAALNLALGMADGGVRVKDETGNVSGSHKARHLAGIMLYLQVAERLGVLPAARPPLAIASCGNAALAAAVVAAAAGWALRVFVPPDADRNVTARLRRLGAEVTACPRDPGTRGDPCYHRLQEALAAGALPFTVQGSDNGLTIEGGSTLGWEMIDAPAGVALDRLFVQVGGGALASACIQAFADAHRLGRLATVPRVHAVQTSGGFPLVRAYDRVADRVLTRCAQAGRMPAAGAPRPDTSRAARAATIAHDASPALIEQEMAYARRHRAAFMWPWESAPRSLAGGILDDETYDWAVIVEGMLQTGGYPVVVSEAQIARANDIARAATGIDVDHTGSAGLAGLLAVLDVDPGIRNDQVAVIFSGVRR